MMERHSRSIISLYILTALLMSLVSSAMHVTHVLAAGIVVNTSYETDPFDLYCTLREALTAANTDAAYNGCPAGSGADTITFAGNYTITLGSQLPAVTSQIAIDGGARTIIQAKANPGSAAYRIFEVSSGGSLTLNQITLRYGRCNGSCTYNDSGGGIYNAGNLSVTNSNLSENQAKYGGGIYNAAAGTLTVASSTFSGNTSSSGGGGIHNLGNLTIIGSTISDNISNTNGGGIYNVSGFTVSNSTFSGNISYSSGGAIYSNGSASITNSTLFENESVDGGGIYQFAFYGSIGLRNTILGGNDGGNCSGPVMNRNNNLDSDGTCGWGTANFSLSNIDPRLGPLGNHGGSTQTHALLAGSPATDAGDDAYCPATDQRGVSRPRSHHCDIGAYEVAYPIVPTFADVPADYLFYEDIEILYANGLTGGCKTSPLLFCPGDLMNRAQAAVFMVRGTYGAGYVPNPTKYLFKDNWFGASYARPWAEAMRETNLTTGCKTSPLLYCPLTQLNREQAVIFGLKMKYGTTYQPPPATGTVFADMTNPNYWATPWAEKAFADGLIERCTTDPVTQKPKFCPTVKVPRGLAAYIIVRAKNLTMP